MCTHDTFVYAGAKTGAMLQADIDHLYKGQGVQFFVQVVNSRLERGLLSSVCLDQQLSGT